MSEPKLDMTALNDALGDDPDSTTVDGRPKQSDSSKLDAHDSPATLSPSPSSPPQEASDHAAANTAAVPASNADPTPTSREPAPHPDPNVQNIKGMFPDMDVETIQAVLVADGGNFEQAINTLLQMSDPTYVPPPPFQRSSQQEQDEQLARSIAAQEEQRSQHQSQPFFPASRGGIGGAAGFRSFLSGGGAESPSSSPSYDPTQLNYQPRVKRTTSGQQQSPSLSSQNYEQRTQNSNYNVNGFAAGSSNIWPGPKEAKEWQNDINRFAETGFAKAASTFSALRQRGEKALNGLNQPQMQQQQGGSSQSSQAAASSWSSRRPATMSESTTTTTSSASAFSPTLGSARGFDQDPSPVGENELAKILAIGREENKKPGIADRYKKLSTGSNRSQSLNTRSAPDKDDDDDDDALGWDDAGRTGDHADDKKKSSSFQPIRISDNSKDTDASKVKLSASPRNAVSLMDAGAGRGIAPKYGDASSKKDAGGADIDGDDDDGNDDLEYVSNPFEDED